MFYALNNFYIHNSIYFLLTLCFNFFSCHNFIYYILFIYLFLLIHYFVLFYFIYTFAYFFFYCYYCFYFVIHILINAKPLRGAVASPSTLKAGIASSPLFSLLDLSWSRSVARHAIRKDRKSVV